jgi:hypothetical protein
MKRLFWIMAPVLWIGTLIVLIIALTVILPGNPLIPYRLVIGLVFISYSAFIRFAYRKLIK